MRSTPTSAPSAQIVPGAGRATRHHAFRPPAARGGHVLWLRSDSVRGRSARLRCLRLGPESGGLHAHLGRLQHRRRSPPRPSERWRTDQQSTCRTGAGRDRRAGIETDGNGWRAKVFLYCVEARCPQTGWMVPLLPTRVVSKGYRVIAELVPDAEHKRYDIAIRSGVTDAAAGGCRTGTVRSDGRGQDPYLIHTVDGQEYRTKISTLRGDYRKHRRHDIAIGYDCGRSTTSSLGPTTSFRNALLRPVDARRRSGQRRRIRIPRVTRGRPTQRERIVEDFIAEHLADWQAKGWVPDMRIEPGDQDRSSQFGRAAGRTGITCSTHGSYCSRHWSDRTSPTPQLAVLFAAHARSTPASLVAGARSSPEAGRAAAIGVRRRTSSTTKHSTRSSTTVSRELGLARNRC